MSDKLLIASKYKKTIEYILIITDNYPHKYIELKTRIINTSFEILENIYITNIEKQKHIYLIPKLKMLDYYMYLSYKYNIITKKKYETISNYLLELIKMINSWINERVNNIHDKINDIDTIIMMYNSIRSKIKNKEKKERFNDFLSINIINIKNIIDNNNYKPSKYKIFIIREPKIRVIMCQSIKDKVINHLVSYYFLIDNFDKNLINNNVATRINKGTQFGLRLFKKYYNYYKNNFKTFYVSKFDIKKYFYNIDHDIVKKLIRNKIKDKKVLKLIEKIIDSTDEDYVNKEIFKLKDKYNVELSIYKKGKGQSLI